MSDAITELEQPATPPANSPWNVAARHVAKHTENALIWMAIAGLELHAQNESLPHGDWIRWVEANCEFSRRTATNYIHTAEKAIKALFDSGVPKENLQNAMQVRTRLEMLTMDDAGPERAAFLTAMRPQPKLVAKKTKPKSTKPATPRGPSPLFTPKVLDKAIARWAVTPIEIKRAFIQAIPREELTAILAAA